MLEKLLKQGRIPSPLILEGENLSPWFDRIALHTFCEAKSACGECRGCKKVGKKFHPDWIHVEGSVKIEDLRARLNDLRQKPFESQKRLFTMENFQDANLFVQNSLLKTLEEPLLHWILIVGVSSRFKLLETIRSRCILYKVIDKEFDKVPLSSDEAELFQLIENQNDLAAFAKIEPLLKDRRAVRDLFLRLLKAASEKGYPGFWTQLAPQLEQGISELNRNLHPRIVFDRAWVISNDDRATY